MPQKDELQNDSFIQNISAIPMNPNHERENQNRDDNDGQF
jgi:hypothetical protein